MATHGHQKNPCKRLFLNDLQQGAMTIDHRPGNSATLIRTAWLTFFPPSP